MTQDYIFIQLTNRIERATGVTIDQIRSRSKKAHIVAARHALCWYLRMYHGNMFTLEYIGKLINRHHTSVSVAVQVASWAIANKEQRIKFILNLDSLVYICPQCGSKHHHTPAVQ